MRVKHLEENVRSTELPFDEEDWRPIDGLVSSFRTMGDRYGPEMMKYIHTS